MSRNTLPIRVHQLWDCIEHAPTGSVLDIEKLTSIALSLHSISKEESITDIKSAVEDGLIRCEEVKIKGVATNSYSLPDPEFINKGDHDWYCFKCHIGGNVVACEDCPRVFHLDCLDEDRKPQQDLFVCPPCHIKATKPSAEKLNIKPKQLNALLTYVYDRIWEWRIPLLEKFDGKIWAAATSRSATKEHWRLQYLVFTQMDLNTIGEKAKNGKYISLEEFQVDCETLNHAIGCYFGPDLIKGSGIGASFMRDVTHDINEIQLCHDCFRRSNEKDHSWWFCLPCHATHEVVWAKQTGYPYWPAKVMHKDGSKYDVRYFGGNYERGNVDVKNILPIDTALTALKVRKNASWNEAYEELQHFMRIAKDPSLIESLPARPRGSGKGSSRASGSRARSPLEDSPMPKRRKVDEAVADVKPPVVRPRTSGNTRLSTGARLSTKSSTQANGMAIKKGSGRQSDTAANAGSDSPEFGEPGHRGKPTTVMTDFFEEFEKHLRDAYTRDGMVKIEQKVGDTSPEEPIEKSSPSTENVVSSTESCAGDSVPVLASSTGNTGKKIEFRENVNKVLRKYKELFNEKYLSDISFTKKKQWCFNCEREAIYHCCWNTAYCSTGCQQYHWAKDHKRLCRRKKAATDGGQ